MFAILGHLFFSLDSQFPLLCFSFLSDQYSQAISNVFQSLLSSAIIVLNYCLSLFLFSSFFLLNSLFVISFKLKAVVRCKTVSHQKRKKRKKKNCAVTSVSFDLPKINSVPSLCFSSYSPNRIYHTYMTLPKELGSWFRQRD